MQPANSLAREIDSRLRERYIPDDQRKLSVQKSEECGFICRACHGAIHDDH